MANVDTSIKNWSATEASNQPDSGDSASIAGDLRSVQAGVRAVYTQASIASSGTTDLGANDAGRLTITGTTTITSFGTVSAGIVKRVRFSGALTLTYNATSLILPSVADISTAADDTAEFESLGSGNWICNQYKKADGTAVVAAAVDISGKADLNGDSTEAFEVLDDAYDESSWNANDEVATKNAIRDEVETVKASIPSAYSPIEGCREYFESSAQTITTGGALALPHSLSGAPVRVELWLENVTAEAGFTTGEQTAVGWGDYAGGRYTSANPDSTNINIRFSAGANCFVIGNASNGASAILTNANWDLIVRAWY